MKFFIFFIITFPSFVLTKENFVPDNFKMNFDQVIQSSVTGKENRSSGTMEYSYPDRVKYIINGKSPITYVSNKEKSWYYTPPFIEGEEGQVTVKEKGNLLLTEIFDLLKYGLVDNEAYKVKTENGIVEIVFEDNIQSKIGILMTRLDFKKSPQNFDRLDSLELIYSNKKKVRLEVKEVKTNLEFDKEYFKFIPPANTRIVH